MLEAKRELERRIAEGTQAPSPAPSALPLRAIQKCEDVFQHRSISRALSEHHADALTRSLKDQEQPLAPITVFWVGNAWACLDGHHRLAAYEQQRYTKPVPVQVFAGTLDDAIAKAAAGNTRDKLPMQASEKMNAAWRLCVATGLSKARIAAAANVSERSVANMRAVRNTLKANGQPPEELSRLHWHQAKLAADGKSREELGWQEARVKSAKRLADRFSRSFGGYLRNNPGVLALALSMYDERAPEFLTREFQEQGLLPERDPFVDEEDAPF